MTNANRSLTIIFWMVRFIIDYSNRN